MIPTAPPQIEGLRELEEIRILKSPLTFRLYLTKDLCHASQHGVWGLAEREGRGKDEGLGEGSASSTKEETGCGVLSGEVCH